MNLNHRFNATAICAAFLIGFGFLFHADRYPATAQQQANPATKWEYKIVRYSTVQGEAPEKEEITKLNDLGAEGWEVTGNLVYRGGVSTCLILKRPTR